MAMSTPLAVALTGLITLGGNFLFDYWTAGRTQSLQEMSGDADTRRKASADERQFQFRIVEKELGQSKSEAERAAILLFLVRAGVLNGLNAPELKSMAEASLKREGRELDSIGVPSLGTRQRPEDDSFLGSIARMAAKLSVGSGPVQPFNDLRDLIASLPFDKASRAPLITTDRKSGRVGEEQRNVRVRVFLYAASQRGYQ
jgi:hypothetical protein